METGSLRLKNEFRSDVARVGIARGNEGVDDSRPFDYRDVSVSLGSFKAEVGDKLPCPYNAERQPVFTIDILEHERSTRLISECSLDAKIQMQEETKRRPPIEVH